MILCLNVTIRIPHFQCELFAKNPILALFRFAKFLSFGKSFWNIFARIGKMIKTIAWVNYLVLMCIIS